MGFDASLGLIIRPQRLVGTYNVPVSAHKELTQLWRTHTLVARRIGNNNEITVGALGLARSAATPLIMATSDYIIR